MNTFTLKTLINPRFLVICGLIALAPYIVSAQVNTDISVDVDASVEVRATSTPPKLRPGTPIPPGIRDTLRAKNENPAENAEARAKLLENRLSATSSRPQMHLLKNASTTRTQGERVHELHLQIFKMRKDMLVRQLTISLNNLKQIAERIDSRIEKMVSEGTDTTEATRLLIEAQAQIDAAEAHIQTVAEFTPSSADLTASSTVELEKPREIGEEAITAVKEAHQALVAVIRVLQVK